MSVHLLSLALLQLSGILGVGIFALPYLYYKSNLLFSILGLLLAAFITFKVNTSYIKIISSLKTPNQLSGYAHKLLGRKFLPIVGVNMILLSFGSLLAFTHMAGKFLNILFPFLSPGLLSAVFCWILFFFYASRNGVIKKVFLTLPVLFILIPVLLFSISLVSFNYLPSLNTPSLDFFGWTMFALSGFTIIPEMWLKTKGNPSPGKLLKNASLLGLILAVVIYLFFVLAIIFLTGFPTPDSITGLYKTHPSLGVFVAIFGLLGITKASLNFLQVLVDIFTFDFKMSHKLSFLLSCCLPFLGLILIGFNLDSPIHFLATFSVLGAIVIIFILRLKLGPVSPHKKGGMFLCILLFLITAISQIF